MAEPELSNEDRDRIGESVQIKAKLESVLRTMIPSATEHQIDTLSHDLADLWDLSQQHTRNIAKILHLTEEDGRRNLDEILSDVLYGHVQELEYHAASLKSTLPGIIEYLSPKS